MCRKTFNFSQKHFSRKIFIFSVVESQEILSVMPVVMPLGKF